MEGRDRDVLGFGFAQGAFSDKANQTYAQDYESVAEVYYNTYINDSISITPSLQYVSNPGGASGVSDAVVFAIRTQITF